MIKQIPHISPGAAELSLAHRKAPAILTAGLPVPRAVHEGLTKMLLVAAGPNESQADRNLKLEAYVEALEGFEAEIVERVLKHLLRHNPRAPFAPHPTDVYEECEKACRFLAHAESASDATVEMLVANPKRHSVGDLFLARRNASVRKGVA